MQDSRRGRTIPMGPGRKLVFELMRQSHHVPLVSVRRECRLRPVAEARRQFVGRLSWVAIFARAFALVAEQIPQLRHNWLSFPYSRIYEHPVSECVVLVEREWDGVETVLAGKLRAPERMTLGELDRHLKRFKSDPVWSVSSFRQLLRLARYPSILRRFLFWSTLSWSGQKRCKRFGTFMISSLGSHACELLGPRMPLTSYLTFGPISPEGEVAVTLIFDHRVLDGRHAARALEMLEELLNSRIAAELRETASPASKGAVPDSVQASYSN